jgi:hypothetical protein
MESFVSRVERNYWVLGQVHIIHIHLPNCTVHFSNELQSIRYLNIQDLQFIGLMRIIMRDRYRLAMLRGHCIMESSKFSDFWNWLPIVIWMTELMNQLAVHPQVIKRDLLQPITQCEIDMDPWHHLWQIVLGFAHFILAKNNHLKQLVKRSIT